MGDLNENVMATVTPLVASYMRRVHALEAEVTRLREALVAARVAVAECGWPYAHIPRQAALLAIDAALAEGSDVLPTQGERPMKLILYRNDDGTGGTRIKFGTPPGVHHVKAEVERAAWAAMGHPQVLVATIGAARG